MMLKRSQIVRTSVSAAWRFRGAPQFSSTLVVRAVLADMAQEIVPVAAEDSCDTDVSYFLAKTVRTDLARSDADDEFITDRSVLVNCPWSTVHLRVDRDRKALQDVLQLVWSLAELGDSYFLNRNAGHQQCCFCGEVRTVCIRKVAVLVGQDDDCGIDAGRCSQMFFDGLPVCSGGVGRIQKSYLAQLEGGIE